jgi:hypothetical protein
LFDTDRQLDTALRVLTDPAAYRPLGQAARRLMEEKYRIEVAISELKDYFERAARSACYTCARASLIRRDSKLYTFRLGSEVSCASRSYVAPDGPVREKWSGNPKDRVASTSSQGLSLTPDTSRQAPDLS